MKKLLYLFTSLSLGFAGCYSSGRVVSDNNNYSRNYEDNNYNQQEVTYQTFYNELQPYGNWISYPGYGYVWQPNAGSDFRPYESNGQWVSTVDGWAWASNYNWGWAPFHYGRWLNDPQIGWAWVPGYDWAPAWVQWGQYDNYYAWAPLAPGVNLGFGNTWQAPYNSWSFLPYGYIGRSNVNRYVVRNQFNGNVINNITIINNYNTYNNHQYHAGPRYTDVEQHTHRIVRPVNIANTTTPGATRVTNNQYQIYRPQVAVNDGVQSIAPARVRTIADVQATPTSRGFSLDNTANVDRVDNNNSVNGNTTNTSNFPDRRYNPRNGGEKKVRPVRPQDVPGPDPKAFQNQQPAINNPAPVNNSQPLEQTERRIRPMKPPVNPNRENGNTDDNIRRQPQQPVNTQPMPMQQAPFRNNRGFERNPGQQNNMPRPQQAPMPQRVERPQPPAMERPVMQPPARVMEAPRPQPTQRPAQQPVEGGGRPVRRSAE